MLELATIWAAVIAFAIFAYVVLDGFVLGVGILFAVVRDEDDRDTMVNSVAPVWDANETWLVMGGGGLLAAFPLAYSIVLSAFYAPLIAMLLALIFRGVSLEFRFRSPRSKAFWDVCFAAGSTLATFCQGIVLGAFVQGIAVEGRAYAGGWFDWLSPFSLLTGVALVIGYALLGAAWLIIKTQGTLQERMFGLAWPLTLGVVGMIVIVSLWTPWLDADIAARWFSWPRMLMFSPVPLLVAANAAALAAALRNRWEYSPYFLALGLFALSYAGLGISLYPYVVPRKITIWEAAAPDASLRFLLVGALVLIPLILAYKSYAYWLFRGKASAETGYH
jgi:cytochrome bd ubiquinol oxidase subunit II